LSGGIDSGLVTAIAKQYNSTLKTFTVSFDGEYDEAPLAKLVAEKI
jgi:asparagine synthase (glutamine-hydrolysing)